MTKEGTVLDGKYEILAEVGRGGMSIILDLLDRPLLVQTLITGKVHDGHTTSTNFCRRGEGEENAAENG